MVFACHLWGVCMQNVNTLTPYVRGFKAKKRTETIKHFTCRGGPNKLKCRKIV